MVDRVGYTPPELGHKYIIQYAVSDGSPKALAVTRTWKVRFPLFAQSPAIDWLKTCVLGPVEVPY